MKNLIKLCVVILLAASCTSVKGYNYGKHYRKARVQKKMSHVFNTDNCKNNNQAYNK